MSDVHVRGMDPNLWKEIRLESVRRSISIAEVLAQMWAAYKKGS